MKRMTESEFNALSDDELEALDMSQIEVVPDGAPEDDDSSAGSNEEAEANTQDDANEDSEDEGDDPEADDDPDGDDDDSSEDDGEAEDDAEDESDNADDASDDDADKLKNSKDAKDGDDEEEDDAEDDEDGEKDTSEGESAQHKAFYDALMQPFKANGVDMTLRTPEEWISMAQKGANYTQKMQGLAPNLKLLRMLENHGVLDEAKLSFLIDLDKRDPAAIQKYLKDADIDPMSVDTDADSTYEGKSHAVSDQEHMFATAVADVANSGVNGKALIREMNAGWDTQSKDAMYQNPGILQILYEQKESGVYDTIMTEVKRRQALGQLTGVPVLAAYKAVGEELTNSGQLQNTGATNGNTGATNSQNSAPKTEVKTRTRKRKRVSDDKRASAAAPSRSGGVKTKQKQDFNPLAMSDEEFEKQFG
jgi:hypothetical protein